jgi:hypothetical protein
MKAGLFLSVLLLPLFFHTSCQKSGGNTAIEIDSAQLLFTPHIDTFLGEYKQGLKYEYTGYSLVFINYLTYDSIIVYADSFGGLKHNLITQVDVAEDMTRPIYIDDEGRYQFILRDYKDRTDSLYCIFQQAADSAKVYDGDWVGYKINQ